MNNTQSFMKTQLANLLNEDLALLTCREKYMFDLLSFPFENSIVLFGAGGLGRKTLLGLRKLGIEPMAFADNNTKLWGSKIEGVPVLSPIDAAQMFGQNSTFVITIWRAGGGHRFAHTRNMLLNLKCLRVVSFGHLFWKYAELFLPYYAIDLPHKLYAQADHIKYAFTIWNDDTSRLEYLAQLRFRFCLDFDGLQSPAAHKQYFPDDLFGLSNNETFIDCGAYDGDTIRNFLELVPTFKGEIIALEPDPLNLESLNRYVATLGEHLHNRVKILALAVGAQRETVFFEAMGTAASGVNPAGSLQVNCMPLDEIIKDIKPTFVKMDIEGAELDALFGARSLIEHALPILAISVYHKPDHMWSIPLFIHSISSQYRFYLRPHNEEGWDLVCYAVPAARLCSGEVGG